MYLESYIVEGGRLGAFRNSSLSTGENRQFVMTRHCEGLVAVCVPEQSPGTVFAISVCFSGSWCLRHEALSRDCEGVFWDVQMCTLTWTFRRNLLPPSSGTKFA
jgi:hypothetical protein